MSRFALRSNLAALAMVAAAGGLLAAPVMAAAPADGGPAAMHEGHRGGGFHKGMRDGLWIPGLGPVSKAQFDQLKLDDKQQALLKTAQDGQRSLHEAMRASGGQRHDLLKAQLDSGKLDPRALLEQIRERQRLSAQNERLNRELDERSRGVEGDSRELDALRRQNAELPRDDRGVARHPSAVGHERLRATHPRAGRLDGPVRDEHP